MSSSREGPGQSSIIRVLLIQLSKAALPLEKTGAPVKRRTFVPRGETNSRPIPIPIPIVTTYEIAHFTAAAPPMSKLK